MQNSQSSNPTVAKLLEAEADLAAQEVELNAHLTSVQEKRHSLKTVIDMFAPVDTAVTVPVATSVQPPEAVAAQQVEPTSTLQLPVVQDVAVPELNGANADTTEAEAPAAPTPQKQQLKKNSSPDSSKPGRKSAPTKKQSKTPDPWQQYVKDEFNDATLSVAVAEVMQQQPEQVLEITTILDAIFANDIPTEVRSTARERVSNVLSVGAKSGKWHRGQLGKYSMSKVAIKDT